MKTILAAVFAALIILLFTFGGRQAASVVVAGSTSVQPYVERLTEEYALLYPDRIVDVQGGGSSAGILAVENGIADIGMSSRALRPDEKVLLWNIEIAKDGLAIIINESNPVDDLSAEQIRRIYTGEITNWKEVGGPDARIHIIAREEGSGTRSAFEELVMDGRRIFPRAIVMNSNGAVRQLVVGDPHAVGFISLGLVEVGEHPVKAVSIDGVAADRDNVLDASYALYRSFLFVTPEEPQPGSPVAQFIEFIFSGEGRQILTGEGLVAVERD
jgi:phosphate transport system substrate-binding protein